MLGLKLNHVSKRGHRDVKATVITQRTIGMAEPMIPKSNIQEVLAVVQNTATCAAGLSNCTPRTVYVHQRVYNTAGQCMQMNVCTNGLYLSDTIIFHHHWFNEKACFLFGQWHFLRKILLLGNIVNYFIFFFFWGGGGVMFGCRIKHIHQNQDAECCKM